MLFYKDQCQNDPNSTSLIKQKTPKILNMSDISIQEEFSKIHIAKPILEDKEKQAVLRIMDSGMLAQGAEVRAFEEEFAKFCGAKHAIATTNGTTALHAALLAHDIKRGDEVITTPFTFIATANTILLAGATPVFCDIDPETFNINTKQLEAKITERTKAILPVHLYGQAAHMKELQQIAERHNLAIIEDACQAHGAQYQSIRDESKNVGSEHTACFSFYPTKNMTTGEGGMVTTSDDKIAEKIRRIISHGQIKRYHHTDIGHNFRMTNIAAAIGRVQLQKLQGFNQSRKQNAKFLAAKLQHCKLITLPEINEGHVVHQFCIRVKNKQRDHLKAFLAEKHIASEVYYPIPIHKQQSFQRYNHQYFPESEVAAEEVLALPVHPSLTMQDLERICKAIQEWEAQKSKGQDTKEEQSEIHAEVQV